MLYYTILYHIILYRMKPDESNMMPCDEIRRFKALQQAEAGLKAKMQGSAPADFRQRFIAELVESEKMSVLVNSVAQRHIDIDILCLFEQERHALKGILKPVLLLFVSFSDFFSLARVFSFGDSRQLRPLRG